MFFIVVHIITLSHFQFKQLMLKFDPEDPDDDDVKPCPKEKAGEEVVKESVDVNPADRVPTQVEVGDTKVKYF